MLAALGCPAVMVNCTMMSNKESLVLTQDVVSDAKWLVSTNSNSTLLADTNSTWSNVTVSADTNSTLSNVTVSDDTNTNTSKSSTVGCKFAYSRALTFGLL